MITREIIFGILSIGIGIVSYSFYFRDIYRGKTKPEGFSWMIWGLLAVIIFFAQINNGGGPGAWVTLFTAGMCVAIAIVAFTLGNSKSTLIDWICLGGALIAIGVWKYTNDTLLGVVLVIAVGALGFFPTFIKTFSKPSEETFITYFFNGIKFGISLFALETVTPVTWLYPVSLVIMNLSLATVIFLRRRS